MADQGTGGQVDVVADADVGGICQDGARQDGAIRADRVQVAVVAEFGVEAGELTVTHGKVAEDFLHC